MMENNLNDKIENKLDHMSEEKKEDILSSFDQFQNYLGDKVSLGEKMGMNEEMLAKAAEKVAGYLAEHEEPKNREEKLLQELWKVGNEEERHKLAHLLVKLVH
ncbi:MAG TPA: DUF3243 domain-containing protein [Chondromyces sp.]|nr:DUF3243 domain-containing protein [Chondromyces sp.]